MPKKDPLAEAIAKLAQVRASEHPVDGIVTLLGEKSGYIIERVADLAAERNAKAAVPALIARLGRLLSDPKADDTSALASLALVRALIAIEADRDAEAVAIVASQYVRWEPIMGGSTDAAVSVRGNACILLASMGSPRALRAATEVLASFDSPVPSEVIGWPARCDAARALTMIRSEAAAAVLRFKLLVGDVETNVLTDCLAGLLAIERDGALPMAIEMLNSTDDRDNDAAMLAIAGWRDARVCGLLLEHAGRFVDSPSRQVLFASLAMTRQPAAIDYLKSLLDSESPAVRADAKEALQPFSRER